MKPTPRPLRHHHLLLLLGALPLLSGALGGLNPALAAAEPAPAVATADAGAPFGVLPLIDEIRCGDPADGHQFADLPQGASTTATLLGKPCRVLPAAGTAKTYGWRIGAGKGLVAGATYVLEVDYPEDQPRTLYLTNRGAETMRGIASGSVLGDVLYSYTGSNPESLRIPLKQGFRTWKTLFRLHDRTYGVDGTARTLTPQDGFWLLISHPDQVKDPASAGAAVSAIRLYAVPDPARFDVAVRFPPAELPRRHLFWREEMADGVISDKEEEKRGVSDRVRWFEYKAGLMKFLGMNTFCKDLLEFGHNQGWDSGPYGGNDWVYQSSYPELWRQTVEMVGKQGFDVLPYYEYSGSVGAHGLGPQRRATPLNGNPKGYTHVEWCENNNADLTDPETLADFCKVLDLTIVRNADAARFVGAWLRPRPSALPIGFADATRARFAKDANQGQEVSREQLAADEALRGRYYQWWYGKRREFVLGVRDWLRGKGVADAAVLYTAYASEEGPSVDNHVITDDVAGWTKLLAQPGHKNVQPAEYARTVAGGDYLQALLRMPGTWGEWEGNHAAPPADPQDYTGDAGVYMTYPFNKAYTTSAAGPMAAFTSKDGLALIRHHALNEQTIPKEQIGYFVSDVERPGPYSMLAEARAMAFGDPRYIGYLVGNSFTRGFPEYAREFNAAYLALPALPSVVVDQSTSDPEVVVRAIATPAHGTWYAVVNTGLADKRKVTVTLPGAGTALTDAATDAKLSSTGTKGGRSVTLDLHACELRALRLK